MPSEMQAFPQHDLWTGDLSERRCPFVASRQLRTTSSSAVITRRFGQAFVWTSDHWAIDALQPLRSEGDPLMDDLLGELSAAPRDDVLSLVQASAAREPCGKAAQLLADVMTVPPWVDWSQIARGQEVFCRHLPAASIVLFNVSLVAGFSAPKITKVLEQSGYLVGAPHRVMKRLFDTGRLLIDSCCEEGALHPGGVGWRSAVRVRALHARVRRRLLRSTTFDVSTNGVPINQEDMAATLLAFSYNVLVGLELLRGEPLPPAEQEAYLHMWRYIGHLLGVRDGCNPCARDVPYAKAFLESIVVHLLQPDDLSVRVAHHLLRAPAAAAASSESKVHRDFVRNAQLTRLLVGDELGDALCLPFVPEARRAVRWRLRMVRAYTRLCDTWLLGAVLTECHRWLMRGLQWADGEAIFPLTATAPTDTTYHATGEGLPPCPLGHHASHSP